MNIPKSVPKKYLERIAHWDDERNIGNSLMVSLKDGWQFNIDPWQARHVEGYDTVKDAIAGLQDSIKCECKECKPEQPKAEQPKPAEKKAGRPRVEHKAKRRNLAFTDSEWAQLTELGRAKWVRLKMQQEQAKGKKAA
jgi:hypothetical protein